MAEPTGLEPATSHVTGERSNQLNYDSAKLRPADIINSDINKNARLRLLNLDNSF